MQLDDVVRLRVPIAGFPDPLGHVRTMKGDDDMGVAYVQLDNDATQTVMFLIRELEVVDLAELEAQAAAQEAQQRRAWTCKCQRTMPGRAMVCSGCGRAKPWKAAA